MELSMHALDQARLARRRVENFARTISAAETSAAQALADRTRAEFFSRLDDDFDTPGALAVLFDYIREQNLDRRDDLVLRARRRRARPEPHRGRPLRPRTKGLDLRLVVSHGAVGQL
jgi:cysteinyl-tRNA synthetase